MPSSSGYTSTIRNIGEVENRGFEFQLDANLLNKAFVWDISANLSLNRNKVKTLYAGQDIFGTVGIQSDYINIIREGYPTSIFYGYLEGGYNSDGAVVYRDINDDGDINELDKTIIGNPIPKFIYSLNSTMSFKNVELGIFIQASQGNDIFSANQFWFNHHYGYGTNMFRDVLYDHWTPETPVATYPRIATSNFTSQRISDRFIYDGSYIRLRNIQLAYNLPISKFRKQFMRSGQVYISAQNLITLTTYPWFDPDVNSAGGAASLNQGIDNFTYPAAKTITLGARFGF